MILLVFLLMACEAPKRKPIVIKPSEDEKILSEIIKELEHEKPDISRIAH